MKRFSKLAFVAAVLPTAFMAAPAVAGSPGQLAQGTSIYVVKDVTSNGAYVKSVAANACDELQFRMQLSNTGFAALDNVTLTATLPASGGTSAAVATTDLGGNSGTHDSVTYSVASGQTISYENGTAALYGDSKNFIKALPDTVTTGGVNVGTISGSTTEYVVFKAKVSCPTPPVTPPPTTPPAPKPTVLPNTGPGDMLGAFAGASTLGTLGHYFVSRRRK